MSRVSSVSCQVKSSSLANKELILIRLNSSWAAEVKTFYCTKTSVRVFFFLPLLVSRCYQGKIDTWKKCTTLVERPKWLPFLQLSAFCTWHLWRPSTHDEVWSLGTSYQASRAAPWPSPRHGFVYIFQNVNKGDKNSRQNQLCPLRSNYETENCGIIKNSWGHEFLLRHVREHDKYSCHVFPSISFFIRVTQPFVSRFSNFGESFVKRKFLSASFWETNKV